MSRQMPEMYLRGAIFNKTMKNLTKDQMKKVEKKIDELLKTPSLTKSREKFCQTLATTIGADYREDKNAAMQEYRIALMKAVIHIMYHKPNEQVFDDSIQTRKLISQFTYMYMRQILTENKISKSISNKYINGEPLFVAHEQIIVLLEEEGIFHTSEFDHNSYTIDGDIGIINLNTARKIGKLKEKFEKIGIEILANIDQIKIIKKKSTPNIKTKITSKNKIHVVSFENEVDEDNDTNRYTIEYEISKKKSKNSFDAFHMRNILPMHLIDLFDFITDMPENSIPNKNEIANHLNITINEVNKKLHQMKYFYYAAKV